MFEERHEPENYTERYPDNSSFPHCAFLGKEWLEQVVALDNLSYPCPWSRELFSREFIKDIAFIAGITNGKALVAHCFNHLVAEELHILNLTVDQKYRRLGLGRALLCFIISESIERGARYATLEVRTSNFSAQRLYSNLGFQVAGLRRQYYHDNLEDALVLSRTLSQRDYLMFRGKMFNGKLIPLGLFDQDMRSGV